MYDALTTSYRLSCPRHGETSVRLSGFRRLEQLVAPALRSRNAERRAAGLQDLQALTELAQELTSLLLWRDVREVANA